MAVLSLFRGRRAQKIFSPPARTPESEIIHPLEADSNVSAAAPVAIMMPDMPDTDMADKLECILHGIDSIVGHRRDPDVATRFQLHVKWEDGGRTWEPECVIQQDAEETVFRYWDDVEGGRSGAMGGEDLWHPLKIEAHRQTGNGTVELKTVWVGSRKRSWETEGLMIDIAHEYVNDYWTSVGGRQKNLTTIIVPAKEEPRGSDRKEIRNGLIKR